MLSFRPLLACLVLMAASSGATESGPYLRLENQVPVTGPDIPLRRAMTSASSPRTGLSLSRRSTSGSCFARRTMAMPRSC
jgi:hypothetical protein